MGIAIDGKKILSMDYRKTDNPSVLAMELLQSCV